MLVFLNGHFLPEAQAVVPVNDRGFLAALNCRSRRAEALINIPMNDFEA
jgi:hypothetical protein